MVEEIKNEKIEETKETSYLYRLEEMIDAIEQSIHNATKVRNQQAKLTDVVKAANDDDFKDLIVEFESQIANLDRQITELNFKVESLQRVITKCKEDKNIENTINEFCLAIGMFRE